MLTQWTKMVNMINLRLQRYFYGLYFLPDIYWFEFPYQSLSFFCLCHHILSLWLFDRQRRSDIVRWQQLATAREEVVTVGRRYPGSRICHKPAAEAARDRQPRTHPHLRLAANTCWPGRREHQRHKAAGRIQCVEHYQVSWAVGAVFTDLGLELRMFLGWQVGLWPELTSWAIPALEFDSLPSLCASLRSFPHVLSLQLPLPVSLTQRLFLVGAPAPSISPLLLWQWELKEKEIPSVILTQICSPSIPFFLSLILSPSPPLPLRAMKACYWIS